MSNRNNLVLVLGAGASKEAGLPIGTELKELIARVLHMTFKAGQQVTGDYDIYEAYQHFVTTLDDGTKRGALTEAGHIISKAMPLAESIDNFIDAHKGMQNIEIAGKLAIAKCILQAERSSKLYSDAYTNSPHFNFADLEKTWYGALFKTLIRNCQRSDIPRRLGSTTIISFNYDRCIKHYLHHALMRYYNVESAKAAEWVANLDVFHPYGSMGPMPWENPQDAVGFGAEVDARTLLKVAQRIKTFTEGTDEAHSDILAIRQAIASTDKLAYLGFAYNEQNLKLLYGNETNKHREGFCSVIGTSYGLSQNDIELITGELTTLGGYAREWVRIRDQFDCTAMFSQFGRSLAYPPN